MVERLSSISAFFPCYNDAPTIGTMVDRVVAVLRELTDDFEVIVIDDGSSDDSVALLLGKVRQMPFLRVVQHGQNRGYGGALRSGFEAATRDFVFYTDGDGQYDPSELALLAAAMRDGIGLVNGYKIQRSDPFHRVIIGKTYELVARWLFGIRLRDVDCDFRLIRTEWLRRIPLTFESGAIGVELVRQLQDAGCPMVEVPVHHYPRLHGRSEFFRLRHVTNLLSDLGRLWLTRRREGAVRQGVGGTVLPQRGDGDTGGTSSANQPHSLPNSKHPSASPTTPNPQPHHPESVP